MQERLLHFFPMSQPAVLLLQHSPQLVYPPQVTYPVLQHVPSVKTGPSQTQA